MIKVSTTGMAVSLKMDLRFPIPGQQGHGGRIIQFFFVITDLTETLAPLFIKYFIFSVIELNFLPLVKLFLL